MSDRSEEQEVELGTLSGNGDEPALDSNNGALEIPRADSEECLEELSGLIRRQIELLGEDPERDGLKRTPERMAKALAFLTSGYHQELEDVVNDAVFETDSDGMVVVRDIEFYSLCEHHMLPMTGKMNVAYIPDGRVVGLSKVARIVDMFARRLQIQEQLTSQVAEALEEIMQPEGVAVDCTAIHFCMMMRGVEKQHTDTRTTVYRGAFRNNPDLQEEFHRKFKQED